METTTSIDLALLISELEKTYHAEKVRERRTSDRPEEYLGALEYYGGPGMRRWKGRRSVYATEPLADRTFYDVMVETKETMMRRARHRALTFNWEPVDPHTELLYRVNARAQGRDPGRPINWKGDEGL